MARSDLQLAAVLIVCLVICSAEDELLKGKESFEGDVSAFLPVVKPVGDLLVQQNDEARGISILSVDDTDEADIAIVYYLSSAFPVKQIAKYFVPLLENILSDAKIDEGKVRVALINFARRARTRFNLSKFTTRRDILREIKKIGRRDRAKRSHGGNALKEVRTKIFKKNKGDRPNVPNVVIILTDNKMSDGVKAFQNEANALKIAGVKIITVGIANADSKELRDAATDPVDKNSVFAKSYDTAASPDVVDTVKNGIRALLDRPPPTRAPVTTTTEATPKEVSLRGERSVDIVFALHFNPNGSPQDFQRLMDFLRDMVATSNVDGGLVRVGLFMDGRLVQFDLNDYTTNAAVDLALSGLDRHMARARNFDLVRTLRDVRQRMFTKASGDRAGIPNALVVITDTSPLSDSQQVEQEARALTQAGVAVYTMGVGLDSKREMEAAASGDNNVFAFAGYSDIARYGGELRKQIAALDTRSAVQPGPQSTFAPRTTQPPRSTLPPPKSECNLARADLIIVLDSSASVTKTNFRKVKRFVKEFLRKADIDTGNVRVGLVTYSTRVQPRFQLNDYSNLSEILRAVDRIPFDAGQTNTAGALDIMINEMFTPVNGDRPTIPNIAVVLTDGVSTVNPRQTLVKARQAHDEGIHIFSIGVGLSDTRELNGIATRPASENSFNVETFDQLERVDDLIFASACPKEYTAPPPTIPETTTTTTTPTTTPTTTTTTPTTTTPTPTTTTPTTTTTTTTTPRPTTTRRTTRRRTTTARATTTRRTTTRRTTTRRTTTTPKPTTPKRTTRYSETGTDLIFMLDSSVNDEIFRWMKSFVTDFTNQLRLDSGEWRVGGMTFDSRSRADFQLNRYHFNDEVIGALDHLRNRHSSRSPDVAGAFDYVRGRMFTRNNGDRPRARNYVVLLTGNEKSLNAGGSYAAATRLKDMGTDVYTIGLGFRNSTELDEISSKPVDEFRRIIYSGDQIGEIPGIILYNMDNAPPPTTRPTTTTTTTTTTRRTFPPYTGECKSRGDVIFLLDTSGSVGEYNYALMKNFTYSIVHSLEVDNGFFRIGVMTFSDTSRIEFHLDRYTRKIDIHDALQRMTFVYGYTNTADALRRIRTEMFTNRNGDRPDVPNLLVVVTDGHSNVNHADTLPEARMVKNLGITIVTVAIGLDDNLELNGMASPPISENVIEVKDFEGLNSLSNLIVTPLCSDADLCARNPCQNEGVCVDGLRSYMCVCTSGYFGDNCEKSCGPPADIVLMLDSSTSVGSVNFAAIKRYARSMVSQMEVLNCGINIGVMKYSSAGMIQFSLGAYDTEEEIVRAISEISFTPGRSNMAEALRVVRLQMFNNRNGDRRNVHNIAFLLTDGTVEINRDSTFSEAELMIDSGVRVVPLAVAMRDSSEIEMIAQSQGLDLLEIDSEQNLLAMSDQVLKAVHDVKSDDLRCKPNPCENGAKCVNEPLGFRCECAEGFTGELCERECGTKADVVFMIDASRYNSGPEFRSMKRFLRDVVKKMAFRGKNFRVGVVVYGAAPRMRLSLLDGDNKRQVKSAIGSLRRLSGDPDLGRAASVVEYTLFDSPGDRPDVPNYVVLLTRSMGNRNNVDAINKLKAKGVRVIGVGIDLSATDERYLEGLVSSPRDQTMFTPRTAHDLSTMSGQFIDFVCEEKNLCAENPCQNGGICENRPKSYTCRCADGYAGKNCERACDSRADVVFLVDSSGSVGFESFRRIKEYIHHVVDSFSIGPDATKVGVATFSQNSRGHIYLDSFSDKQGLQSAISGISYVYGNTNTASGIKLARSSLFSQSRGNRPDVPDFLIIITDGLSNVNHESTIPEAEYARSQGIHIFAIGVGVSDDWELKGMASKPVDKNVFQITGWEELWEISDQLIDRTCRDRGVCAESPCKNSGTCVAGVGTFTCECIQGFLGRYCELDCSASKDITLILDGSASVGPGNFLRMLNYTATLVKDLTGSGQDHRFSLITYSSKVQTIFTFNRYNRPQEVINAIRTTTYQAGSTNTADALRQAIELYKYDFGARPSSKDVVILLTDGQSNVNYYDTLPAAIDLKATGAKVIGIGIGLKNFDEINGIASSTRDVFPVTSFENLADIEHDILKGTCEETV